MDHNRFFLRLLAVLLYRICNNKRIHVYKANRIDELYFIQKKIK